LGFVAASITGGEAEFDFDIIASNDAKTWFSASEFILPLNAMPWFNGLKGPIYHQRPVQNTRVW
jgi:hypothetical protein